MYRKEAAETLALMMSGYSHIRKNEMEWEALSLAIEALKEPERKKGKWISELKDDGDSLLRCSICNYPVSYFWGRTNFCPECGADLREKNNGKIKTEND